MRRDLFEDFCREYVRELNRLRMEHRASLSHGRQELAAVEREIRRFIQALKDGVSALSIKDELLSLEARKAELQSRLDSPEMPELLHPRMADVYREKVGGLCLALESEESRIWRPLRVSGGAQHPRQIALQRNLQALAIGLEQDRFDQRSDGLSRARTGDLMLQIKLVAGARSPLNLEFSWTAA